MPEIVLDGQRIEHEVHGADGARPLLIVQNVQAPMRMWPHRDDCAALVDAGFALVRYRHHGETDTMEEYAADLGRLLDHLGLRDVAIWGYSQGAMAAQELALARPDLVSCAVLMATRGRLSAMDRFRYAIEAEIDTSTELGAFAVLLMQYGADALCDDDRFQRYLSFTTPSPASEPAPADAESFRQRANRMGSRYGDPSRLPALAGVEVPSLVVAFADDGNIPPTLNREVADAIPGCGYVEIARAGHAGGMTHRAEVRDLVLPFLLDQRV